MSDDNSITISDVDPKTPIRADQQGGPPSSLGDTSSFVPVPLADGTPDQHHHHHHHHDHHSSSSSSHKKEKKHKHHKKHHHHRSSSAGNASDTSSTHLGVAAPTTSFSADVSGGGTGSATYQMPHSLAIMNTSSTSNSGGGATPVISAIAAAASAGVRGTTPPKKRSLSSGGGSGGGGGVSPRSPGGSRMNILSHSSTAAGLLLSPRSQAAQQQQGSRTFTEYSVPQKPDNAETMIMAAAAAAEAGIDDSRMTSLVPKRPPVSLMDVERVQCTPEYCFIFDFADRRVFWERYEWVPGTPQRSLKDSGMLENWGILRRGFTRIPNLSGGASSSSSFSSPAINSPTFDALNKCVQPIVHNHIIGLNPLPMYQQQLSAARVREKLFLPRTYAIPTTGPTAPWDEVVGHQQNFACELQQLLLNLRRVEASVSSLHTNDYQNSPPQHLLDSTIKSVADAQSILVSHIATSSSMWHADKLAKQSLQHAALLDHTAWKIALVCVVTSFLVIIPQFWSMNVPGPGNVYDDLGTRTVFTGVSIFVCLVWLGIVVLLGKWWQVTGLTTLHPEFASLQG